MEGDTTLIKLLSHHFRNDGRTLVCLSGVNRLWRKLLRREPDGALFIFCKNAFSRLPPNATLCEKDAYIDTFLEHASWSNDCNNSFDMMKTLIVYSCQDTLAVRKTLYKGIQQVREPLKGNVACTGPMICEASGEIILYCSWQIEVFARFVPKHFDKWLWRGELERRIWWHDDWNSESGPAPKRIKR